MKTHVRKVLILLTLLGLVSIMSAQDEEGRAAIYSSRYLSMHGLIQAGTRFRIGSDPTGGTYANNITAHTSRLQLIGDLGDGFDFYVQWEFTKSPGLLDTRIDYRLNDLLSFRIGFFKTPGGREFLTPTEQTDFVSSASLLALGTQREAGVQTTVSITKDFRLSGGLFNGNGSFLNSDNTDLLGVARISYASSAGDRTIESGISAARDPQTTTGGEYSIVSADAKYAGGNILGVAEVMYRTGKAAAGAPTADSYGFYATAGYSFDPSTSFKVRYQRLAQGTGSPKLDDVILNLGHSPNSFIALSLELIVPVKSSVTLPTRILTQVQMYL